MPVSRRQIVRACKARGWQLQPDALKGAEEYLQDGHAIDDDLLDALAVQMENAGDKRTVTSDIWEAFLKEEEEHAKTVRPERLQTLTSNPWTNLEVISAFRDVRLVYQTMKKHFHVEEQPWSLFGKAEDKVSQQGISGTFTLFTRNGSKFLNRFFLYVDSHACPALCLDAATSVAPRPLSHF
jgi:hypothetical protein